MTERTFYIQAEWDDDAKVWVATSTSVPGLVVQGTDKEQIVEKIRLVIPSLIEVGIEPEDTINIFFRANETSDAGETMTVPFAQAA